MIRSQGLAVSVSCLTMAGVLSGQQVRHVELDHVYIVVPAAGLDEIAALRSAGLTVSAAPTKHEGQGTASVSVLFENAYLELIWVDSTVSVLPELSATFEWFRRATAWRTSGTSPFGIGLRRLPGDSTALPVPVKREFAPWLPPGSAYELLHQPADSLAADFFVVPPGSALPAWIERVRRRMPALLNHQGGGREITLVRVGGTALHEPVAFDVLRPQPIEMVRSIAPVLELQIDGGTRGQRVDLRPALPLVILR